MRYHHVTWQNSVQLETSFEGYTWDTPLTPWKLRSYAWFDARIPARLARLGGRVPACVFRIVATEHPDRWRAE